MCSVLEFSSESDKLRTLFSESKENIANEFRKIQWRLTTWKQQRDTN